MSDGIFTEEQVRAMIAGREALSILVQDVIQMVYWHDPMIRRKVQANTGGGKSWVEENEDGLWPDLEILYGRCDTPEVRKIEYTERQVSVVTRHYTGGGEYAGSEWSLPLSYLWLETEDQLIRCIQEAVDKENLRRRAKTQKRLDDIKRREEAAKLEEENDARESEGRERAMLQELLAKYPQGGQQ